MGAVLAIAISFDSFAATVYNVDFGHVYIITDRGDYIVMSNGGSIEATYTPSYIDIIDVTTGGTLSQYDLSGYLDKESNWDRYYADISADAHDFSVTHKIVVQCRYEPVLDFYFRLSDNKLKNKHVYDFNSSNFLKIQYIVPGGTGSGYIDLAQNFYRYNGFYRYYGYLIFGDFDLVAYNTPKYSIGLHYVQEYSLSQLSTFSSMSLHVKYVISPLTTFVVTYDDVSEDILDQIDDDINKQTAQDKAYHDQDKNDATAAGQQMTGMATQLEDVKNKWAILWYPIEFTNKIFGAFQGSSSASYTRSYAGVTGYTYDDSSGELIPVYSKTRAAPASGTTITFPEYILPVLNVKVWDGYSYDLSTLKVQFPAVFDGIYVIVTILEIYWFVGFLRSKYEEVFG